MKYYGFGVDQHGIELLNDLPEDELINDPDVFLLSKDAMEYRPNGREKCWKCSCKHLGAAAALAAELGAYPHHFVRMVGELYQAHQEVPDKELSQLLRTAYRSALERGAAPDFERLIKAFYPKFQQQLHDWQ